MTDRAQPVGVVRHRARLRYQIALFTLARAALNTGHRMVYPFLPTFARGVGVDLEAVALAVTARAGLGLVSPVFGALADRHGRRLTMIAGLLIFATAMVLVTLWPTYPALFAAIVLAGTSKLLFDPAMQAYIGDRVTYGQRGLALALTEVSWSGAFLVGIPLLGWLIARTDAWQTPFPLLGAGALLAAALLWRLIPPDGMAGGEHPTLAGGVRLVLAHRAALAGLSVGLLISASNETIGIIYGAWMEEAFALKVTALGASAIVIGVAELVGEGAVAGFVDRLGKRRAAAGGIAANAVTCLLLPALDSRVETALVGLFLFYLTFEFAIVSSIPLMTELVPGARATLMAANVTAFSAGRMTGALLGPVLFSIGLLANCSVAALGDGLALMALLCFIPRD
jgi:predicted MFS family arabinose efflux permease